MNQIEIQELKQQVTRDRKQKGTYWVQSFNSKHAQLYYRVILRPENDEVSCSCEAFKYHPELVCKHILRCIQREVSQ